MSSGLNNRPWSRLGVRLALWHSIIILGVALSVLGAAYFVLQRGSESLDKDMVLMRVFTYSQEYRRAGMEGVHRLASLRKGRAQKAYFVRIADPKNKTLFMRDTEDWAEFFPSQNFDLAIDLEDEPFWQRRRSPAGYDLLVYTEHLPDGQFLQIGKDTEETQGLLIRFRTFAVSILIVLIPASFIAGTFFASRALRPIQALTRTLREVERTAQPSPHVPETGANDELDELVRVFNAASTRIDTLLRTMRESLDNVAHDLRTPMTRLRHRAEAALMDDVDRESAREALISCVEESDHVLATLNTLMDIAEAEAGITHITTSPVNVAALVESALDLYTEVADDKNVSISAQIDPGLQVCGDCTLLRRVLANLLDNALKYSPNGGKVCLSAKSVDDMVEISVRDNGNGIPAEDLPRVWERLYRGDKSRSERGLGLGLSFVKAIVIAHGGSVSAESQPGQGAHFTIRIPRSEFHGEPQATTPQTAIPAPTFQQSAS